MNLLDIFRPLLQNNQFATGGLALMAVGAVGATLRKVPGQVIKFVEGRFSVTIDVQSTDPAFEWLTIWLDQHPYSRRTKRLSVQTKQHMRDPDGNSGPQQVMLSPAPGPHFFFYKGRMVWLRRERKETEKGGLAPAKETFELQIMGRSQDIARSLIEDARRLALRAQERQARIYLSAHGYWTQVGLVASRPLESVVLPEGVKEGVVDDLQKFLDGQQWYRDRGVPYRRGYLFHGLPGTGKSSLVAALAGRFGLNLYVLNISSVSSDDKLLELLSEVRERSIVLLEDIDAATKNRAAKKEGEEDITHARDFTGVSISGLLNALDGVTARDGALVFLTTNYKDRLDAALIRSGRCDVHVEFTAATAPQAQQMYARFYPDAPEAAGAEFGTRMEARQLAMADIQQHLIMYSHSAEAALSNA